MRVLVYDYCGGYGFADMMRSLAAFKQLCADHNIQLYIDIQGHPVGKYLEIAPEHVKPGGIVATDANINEIYTTITNKGSSFSVRVSTNWYRYRPAQIGNSTLKLNFPIDFFGCAVYFRCGDLYHGHTPRHRHDNLTDFPIEDKLKQAINACKQKCPGVPIYLFSDHKPFRDEMCKTFKDLRQLETVPVHVGHSKNDDEGTRAMLIDFFSMAKARLVVDIQNKQSWHPGGFATRAAMYGNVERLVIE